jgi:transposase
VFWDFPDCGYCCPECGEPFSPLSDHWSGEQLDWQVIVRVAAHCRRRYKRECACRVPATVTAPGPPKAIGKGLFTDGFIAMLLTERYIAGRSMNSLVTGLSRQGADISPATLAGTCAQAGAQALERFPPWNAGREDLRTWAQPPPPGKPARITPSSAWPPSVR